MKENDERAAKIISVLDKRVRTEGYEYIYECAYNVYKTMLEKGIDRIDAATVLYALASDVGRERKDDIREQVAKRLLLDKDGAELINGVFYALYAEESLSVMRKEEYAGLDEFCSAEHEAVIEAEATWCQKRGAKQDYTCTYRLTFRVAERELLVKDLRDKLRKNPFLKEADIYKHCVGGLKEFIADEFEEYCTCDDYYPPAVEDFPCNCVEEIEDYLRNHGIELISDEFDYRESDFY